ncbi:MAG TPA: hypothetical protein DEH78_31980 [Solibacterales bacterium]|nr:hypothetical protein [Bryobacterales bacterium]
MPQVQTEVEVFQAELARLLASDTLRTSESLRRLLAYLGEAHLNGIGRDLKEYTIGRDVMGKPPDYDPRVDASVRVQIGKLRQRLDQYYSIEAPEAPVQIRLPKGHFELVVAHPPAKEAPPVAEPQTAGPWRGVAFGLALVCAILSAALVLVLRPAGARPSLPAPLTEYWAPFASTDRPAVVVLGSPLFIRFHSFYFRNPWTNSWDEVRRDVPLEGMRSLLKTPTDPSPTYRWTPFGEAAAAFRLASVLSPAHNLVLKRSIALAWEDVRHNNLVFLGPPKFNPQLRDLPVVQDFVIDSGMVKNLRPQPGEAATYEKPSPANAEEIPEDYAVITRVRATGEWGEILVLASSSTEGTWAAADFVTSPTQVEGLLRRLRDAKGDLPGSYQVLLRSRFKSQVPIQTEYVTHHVLRPAADGK